MSNEFDEERNYLDVDLLKFAVESMLSDFEFNQLNKDFDLTLISRNI